MAAQYHESLRGDLADTAADTDREPCQVEEDGMAHSRPLDRPPPSLHPTCCHDKDGGRGVEFEVTVTQT